MIMMLRLEGNSVARFRVTQNHLHVVGVGHDMQRIEESLKWDIPAEITRRSLSLSFPSPSTSITWKYERATFSSISDWNVRRWKNEMKPRGKAYHARGTQKAVDPRQEKHDEELREKEVENRGTGDNGGKSEQKRAVNRPVIGPGPNEGRFLE